MSFVPNRDLKRLNPMSNDCRFTKLLANINRRFIIETCTVSSSEVIKRKNLLNSRVYREIGGFSFEYFSVHSTAFTV